LTLSGLESGDAPAVFDYRSDDEVSRYQGFEPRTLHDVEKFIRTVEASPFGTEGAWFQFGIRLRESGLLIGDLGTHFVKGDPLQVEIGITVSPRFQRRGYAAEALAGIVDFLFERMNRHRAYASVDPRNEASVALLVRAGWRQEAHFRQSLRFKGEWVDDLVFAILRSEWQERRDPGLPRGQT
jgi:RimJ/RimL family protein N-acetyltransferase